jgi:nicotinamidase-related amidase
MSKNELPLPSHYQPDKVGEVWRVPYQQRAEEARTWAAQHGITPAAADKPRIGLLLVDVQNTFCIPGFELFVGGRSGKGAVEDNQRLCSFIYYNLHRISDITLTMDTHQAMQIFHAIFLVDENGNHPAPMTLISSQDIKSGRWKFNPAIAPRLGIDPQYGQRHLAYYVEQLEKSGRYQLTIWPYHAMLGGIGHAIVSAVEEAVYFHGMARAAQPQFEIKGANPLTEHYSVLGPEVMQDVDGKPLGEHNQRFLQKLKELDILIITGQAKSHCVAFTIKDLLGDILTKDANLAKKVYLLEDCCSPVVVPGIIDYTDQADQAFQQFAEAGMHLIRSTEPIDSWLKS